MVWVARQTGVGYLRAATMLLCSPALMTLHETIMTLRMQRILRKLENARSIVNAAPKFQPYRNEAEVRILFQRLAIPIKQLQRFRSCYIVEM